MKSAGIRTGQVTPVAIRSSNENTGDVTAVVVPPTGVAVEALERALIDFALQQTGGNRSRAARFLRLSRSALLYRMQKYGLIGPDQHGVLSCDGGADP